MKQFHNGDLNVNVELPSEDIEDILDKLKDTAITIIGFYMAADVLRYFLKQ